MPMGLLLGQRGLRLIWKSDGVFSKLLSSATIDDGSMEVRSNYVFDL